MGNKPQASMDREKAYIPDLQIDFIDNIALPVYKDLSALFPASTEARAPFEAVAANRDCWRRAHEALLRRGRDGRPGNVRDIFDDAEIEREILEGQQ